MLVRPEHAGNVGASARALGNLGLSELRLVGGVELDASARAMACSFQDLLAAAGRYATLTDAIADCALAIAMVSPMRHRDGGVHDLRALRPRIVAASERGKVALVFGPEQSGLAHADVALCSLTASLFLPSARPTLNVAQAVLLAGYELCTDAPDSASAGASTPSGAAPAAHGEVEIVLRAVDGLLTRLGYQHAEAGVQQRIVDRCRAMAQRASLSRHDVQMLHGILARLDPRRC